MWTISKYLVAVSAKQYSIVSNFQHKAYSLYYLPYSVSVACVTVLTQEWMNGATHTHLDWINLCSQYRIIHYPAAYSTASLFKDKKWHLVLTYWTASLLTQQVIEHNKHCKANIKWSVKQLWHKQQKSGAVFLLTELCKLRFAQNMFKVMEQLIYSVFQGIRLGTDIWTKRSCGQHIALPMQ